MCNFECNHQQFGYIYIYMYIIYISPLEVWCEAHLLARNAPLSRTPKGCGPIWFQGSDKQIHPICLLQLKRVPIVPKEQMPNTVYIYLFPQSPGMTCSTKPHCWKLWETSRRPIRSLRRTSGPTSRSVRPGKPYKYIYIYICIIYLYTHTQSFTCVSMHGYVCRHTHASLVYIYIYLIHI